MCQLILNGVHQSNPFSTAFPSSITSIHKDIGDLESPQIFPSHPDLEISMFIFFFYFATAFLVIILASWCRLLVGPVEDDGFSIP